jgi:murein DD-endopeptidase MepM/ murein hydrolase activator NlpD
LNAQRNRSAALNRASGFEDGPALTVQSTDGEIPQGRELSIAWLAGTVMTGLTSVLLMGAALYVSFEGQDTFSTAYEALHIVTKDQPQTADLTNKQSRVRPIAQTRSEREVIEASIKENVEGRDMIRMQEFVRVRATLATAATALTDDVPAYDPVAILNANEPITSESAVVNTDIYGADVEGEVQIKLAALPISFVPRRAISDQTAAEFVRLTVEGAYSERDPGVAMAYAPADMQLRELGIESGVIASIAENVTVLPKTTLPEEVAGRTERILTVKEDGTLRDVLLKNGFTESEIGNVLATLQNVYPSLDVKRGTRLRILLGPSRQGPSLIPFRVSIYNPPIGDEEPSHAATAALTDKGSYVLGLEPSKIPFPEEDTEAIDVSNLPTIYRSIWETARKNDLEDATTARIVAMFAYDIDMTKRIAPGDMIEVLQTPPDAEGRQELLYVALTLGGSVRELFRFRGEDGTIDFYDPDGETGKRFLTRRPLEGGGTLRSRFGNRNHPIFGGSKMHTGIDLSSKTGTPIYASGDGTVDKAQWLSGYGRYVSLTHVNGFETAYGHMSRIADGIVPGTRVRQGQIIGYVGSTGYSTGPHLHFEIKVNGRFVDPLSVRLPRDKVLSAQYEQAFGQTMEQIRELMAMDPAGHSDMTVASSD